MVEWEFPFRIEIYCFSFQFVFCVFDTLFYYFIQVQFYFIQDQLRYTTCISRREEGRNKILLLCSLLPFCFFILDIAARAPRFPLGNPLLKSVYIWCWHEFRFLFQIFFRNVSEPLDTQKLCRVEKKKRKIFVVCGYLFLFVIVNNPTPFSLAFALPGEIRIHEDITASSPSSLVYLIRTNLSGDVLNV
jgi:hypothetical protein